MTGLRALVVLGLCVACGASKHSSGDAPRPGNGGTRSTVGGGGGKGGSGGTTAGRGGAAGDAGGGERSSSGAPSMSEAGAATTPDAGDGPVAGAASDPGGSAGKPSTGGHGQSGEGPGGEAGQSVGGSPPEDAVRVEHPALPHSEPVATSGTRLRRRFVVGEDGSRHFVGFRDTTLGFDCTFMLLGELPATDARFYYCAPTGVTLPSTAFSSDSCEVPAASFPETCAGTRPAYVLTDSRLDGGYVPFATCVPGTRAVLAIGDPLDACGSTWTAAEPVAPSELVRGELVRVDLGDGLYVERIEGDDGSAQTASFWHAGVRCKPFDMGNGETRCTSWRNLGPPTSQYGLPETLDPIDDDECGPARYCVNPHFACAIEYDVSSTDVYEMAGPVVPQHDGTCFNSEPFDYQGLGIGPLEHDVLPALQFAAGGNTRLRNIERQTDSDSSVALGEIYDSALERNCKPERVADGTLRCVPDWGRRFSALGSDCHTPAAAAYGCHTMPFYAELSWRAEACRAEFTSFFRPTYFTNTLWVRPEGEPCSEYEPGEGYVGLLLEPVETTTFASLTEEIE